MIPDWAPNLHPLVVHFPISLLFAAALVDVIGLFSRAQRGLRTGAVVLYVAGAAGALASYITGNRAAESVDVPTEAIATLNTHQDLALYTLLFFAAYAIGRVALFVIKPDLTLALYGPIVLLGIGGQLLVWQTGEYGGRLVFEHGIGVAPVEELSRELRIHQRREQAAAASPTPLEGGGYRWTVGPGAEEAFDAFFRVVDGARENVSVSVSTENDGHVLSLDVHGSPVLLVGGERLENVDAEMEIDPSELQGSVALVHNVVDAQSYHFLRIDDAAVILGRVADAAEETMSAASLTPADRWTTLRATAHAGHFYGYVDGETVGHGHSVHPSAGTAGLRIDGEGRVRLRRIEVRAVE